MFKSLNTTSTAQSGSCIGLQDLACGSMDNNRCVPLDLKCLFCDGGPADSIEGCNSKHDIPK